MTFTVTVTHNTGGHLAQEGEVSVEQGATFSDVITADEGYVTGLATIDGVLGTGPNSAIVISNVQADHTVYVEFATALYAVTLASNYFPCLVTLSPLHYGYRNYAAGTVVTITAVPSSGYRFFSWTGDITGGTNPQTPTMASNISIGAVFVMPNTYVITPSAGANGSIYPSAQTQAELGAQYNFTFTPDSGYAVADVLVDGSSVGTPSSYAFTNVSADHTISVTFEAITVPEGSFLVTTQTETGITISPIDPVKASGTSQVFTLTPRANYALNDVFLDNISVKSSCVWTSPSWAYTLANITADHTLRATAVYIPTVPGIVVPPAGIRGDRLWIGTNLGRVYYFTPTDTSTPLPWSFTTKTYTPSFDAYSRFVHFKIRYVGQPLTSPVTITQHVCRDGVDSTSDVILTRASATLDMVGSGGGMFQKDIECKAAQGEGVYFTVSGTGTCEINDVGVEFTTKGAGDVNA
jgi:hypothetical protein